MKVQCKKDDGFITINRMYDVISQHKWNDRIFYQIIDNNSQRVLYDESYFDKISEIRKEKLLKLNLSLICYEKR